MYATRSFRRNTQRLPGLQAGISCARTLAHNAVGESFKNSAASGKSKVSYLGISDRDIINVSMSDNY